MSLLNICKLQTLKFAVIFGATVLAAGQASAAPALAIFEGFVGYDALKASMINEAKSEVDTVLTSKASSGDLNNMCVVYALSKEYVAAESSCFDAITKAKKENVSGQTLKAMKSNLKIVTQQIQDYSSAAD